MKDLQRLVDGPWEPDTMDNLRRRLQAEQCVMDSQRPARQAVMGGSPRPERPAIELS